MAVRLGDLLLQDGVLNTTQLEEALKYQVIFGGKLGTNLIEMGFVEEEDVSRVLGKKFGVPTVDPEELMNTPHTVLEAFPRALVEKFGVVPCKLEGKRLSLVMPDPSDLKALDEIAFRTGLIVKPLVAAEVRIVLALEKLYGIERERRYIHAVKKVVSRRRDKEAKDGKEKKENREAKAAKEAPAHQVLVAPAVKPVADVPAVDWLAAPEAVAEQPEAEIVEELEELEEIADAETVSDNLAEPRDRDDILDTLAAYLAHEFAGSAVFLVRGELVLGWKATSEHRSVPTFRQLEIPLTEESVLKTVVESRATFLGPVPRAPFNSMLLQELGGRVPKTVLLVPLLMMGRVVGVLYVDDAKVDLGDRLLDLQKLTAKAAMAFEILVLKNKILSM